MAPGVTGAPRSSRQGKHRTQQTRRVGATGQDLPSRPPATHERSSPNPRSDPRRSPPRPRASAPSRGAFGDTLPGRAEWPSVRARRRHRPPSRASSPTRCQPAGSSCRSARRSTTTPGGSQRSAGPRKLPGRSSDPASGPQRAPDLAKQGAQTRPDPCQEFHVEHRRPTIPAVRAQAPRSISGAGTGSLEAGEQPVGVEVTVGTGAPRARAPLVAACGWRASRGHTQPHPMPDNSTNASQIKRGLGARPTTHHLPRPRPRDPGSGISKPADRPAPDGDPIYPGTRQPGVPRGTSRTAKRPRVECPARGTTRPPRSHHGCQESGPVAIGAACQRHGAA